VKPAGALPAADGSTTQAQEAKPMTALSNALKTLAAARNLAAVNAVRNEITRQAEAGTLAGDAAAALLTAARVRLDELADQGDDREDEPAPPAPRRTAQPAPAGDRLAAVIHHAEAAEYPDSGPLVRGTVAVFTNGVEQLVKFRIPRSWEGSIRALFSAAGLPEDADAEQLVGKTVAVVLGEFQGRDGEPRPTVKRWHRPAPATRTATLDQPREVAAMPHPAAARAPRRTPAAKARAEFQANDTDGDDIPF
jgi:hypothetical protein